MGEMRKPAPWKAEGSRRFQQVDRPLQVKELVRAKLQRPESAGPRWRTASLVEAQEKAGHFEAEDSEQRCRRLRAWP